MKLQGFEQAIKMIYSDRQSKGVAGQVLMVLPNEAIEHINKAVNCLHSGREMSNMEDTLVYQFNEETTYTVEFDKKQGLNISLDIQDNPFVSSMKVTIPTDRMLKMAMENLVDKPTLIASVSCYDSIHSVNNAFAMAKNGKQVAIDIVRLEGKDRCIHDLKNFLAKGKDRVL